MGSPPSDNQLRLVYTQEYQQHESPAFYVFQRQESGGYVIASADERAYPILGYNESGTFCEDSLPCCLKFILEEYTRQIAYAREHNQPRPEEEDDFGVVRPNIRPLLTSVWNQLEPFNNLCPIDNRTGERSVTGCMATAMAQIMYYHKWPKHGIGSHSYHYNWDTILTANFGETIYRWDLMKDAYDDEHGFDDPENAVATLMYHCGVAMNMKYSSEGSGTSDYMISSLCEYFDYSDLMTDVSPSDETAIYNELLCGRPVFVTGRGKSFSHAYICDGYRTDGFFHFNLGWGGNQDGYYLFDAVSDNTLSPHVVIIRITPSNREKTTEANGCIYKVLDDNAYLTEGGKIKGHLDIPSKIIFEGKVCSVKEIFWYAFGNNTELTSITIPNSVNRIGYGAFYGCDGLTSVISYIENPFAIDKNVFEGRYDDVPLYVPVGTLEKYKSTNGWKMFKNIVEFDTNGIESVYSDENNHEMKNDNRWYSVDGVKLGGEPTKKGLYIHNGKKVVK